MSWEVSTLSVSLWRPILRVLPRNEKGNETRLVRTNRIERREWEREEEGTVERKSRRKEERNEPTGKRPRTTKLRIPVARLWVPSPISLYVRSRFLLICLFGTNIPRCH